MKRLFWILSLMAALLVAACQSPAAEPTAEPTAIPAAPVATATTAAEPAATDAPLPTAETPATATAEPAAEATALPTPEPPSVEFEGIRFEQGGLATAVLPTLVPEQISTDGPYWNTYPAYYLFDFEGYPLENTFHKPRIEIYPAAAFAGLNLAARDDVEALTTLLDERPTDLSGRFLPFMPIFNAAQVFHAQDQYLDFVNGRGLRYITMFSQSIDDIANNALFYTYQGLTNDGNYYVAMVLPISSAILPAQTPNRTAEEWETFSKNYETYLADTTAALDALTAGEFLPTLDALDQLVASLEVAPPTAARPTNATGETALALDYPVDQGQYMAGETITVAGVAGPTAGPVAVNLMAGPHPVVELTAEVDPNTGAWQTAVTLPTNFSGPATVRVSTASEETTHTFTIFANQPAEGETSITIYRPYAGERLVEGLTLFVQGQVTAPIDEMVTIGVLINDCQEFIARQSFSVTGGEWTGLLILPRDITGPACLTTYTGSYDGTWVENMITIPIVAQNDPTVSRLTMGNSYGTIQKGVPLTLYGTAVNPPDNSVELFISDNNGNPITTLTASVDAFGYWEADLTLAADAPDFILVTARFTEDGVPIEYQTGFDVQ